VDAVNVRTVTGSAIDFGEFVESELGKSQDFLSIAVTARSAGNVAAANRAELSALRAYEEALYLFSVLRRHISQAGARRLAIRIKKIGKAMHGG
jgi:hypothetical protein